MLEVEVVGDEAGGHDVVLVDVLDEGLDASALDELLLAEGALDLAHVAGDPCHQQVGEAVLLRAKGSTLLPSS